MTEVQAAESELPGGGIAVTGLADVPRARHYVSAQLRTVGGEDLRDVAELATTELVTNALLHGRRPVEVRIVHEAELAHIEVFDASPVLPVLGQSGGEEMTGRGLALLDALSDRWGVRPVPGGKVVWCDLTSDGAADDASGLDPALFAADVLELAGAHDAVTASPEDRLPAAPGHAASVLLPDVPVTLLLAHQSHVDDLVRDLTLAGNSRSPWRDDTVPAAVAARLSAAADAIGQIRRSLRRQALEARAAGADTIAIAVPTDPDVVDTVCRYQAALDEADGYCRAARLLTLEAPPQHQVLRQWMVDELLAAMEAAHSHADAALPPVQSFRDRLLQEIGGLATVQRTAARAGRLQQVATGLSRARTQEEVAAVVLEQGAAALGAARAALLVQEDGRLRLIGARGMGESAMRLAAAVALDEALPTTDAVRAGRAVWIESLAERDRRYPELARADPASRSLVATPLVVGGRSLGVLRFGFDSDLVVDEDERSFVAAIAAQAASALDRSLTYDAERRARQQAERTAGRLHRLQEVTAALSGSVDEAEVAALMLGNATEALGAGIATLSLLTRPGPPELLEPDAEIRVPHFVGVTETARERWSAFSLADPVPVADVIRSGRPVVLPTVAELHRRYPRMAGPGMPVEEHALVVMPLAVGDRRLGALTLSFFDGREYAADAGDPLPEDLAFLSSLADVCAQALDRADAVRSLRTASSRLAFLAEASVELAASLDEGHILRRVAELAVPIVADWCWVTVEEGGALRTVAIAHPDPVRRSRAAEVDRRFPPETRRSVLYRVLSSGRSEVMPGVSDEHLAEWAVDAEHAAGFREIGPLGSVMIVPMAARGKVLGVLTLASSSGHRTSGPEDLSLAEDLARRAGLAVETARLLADRAGHPDT